MYDTRETYLPYGGMGGHEDFAVDPQGTTYQQDGWYLGEPLLDVPPSFTPIADLLDAGRDPSGGYLPPQRTPEEDVTRGVGFDLPRTRRPVPHRRRRPRPQLASWPQITSSLFGVLTTCTVTAVSLLGWIFSYAPLQQLAAAHVSGGLAELWPVIIYGPWFVASLSILRAALDRRRIAHSWVVLGIFSGMAAILCVASASATLSDVIVAGLPPITAVISFHQLIRQMTATRRARHGPTPPPRPRAKPGR
ncbi:DUF2637 domain-containing protein [Streptacidiphilus griseoplanus]|uniref:DUF2637 domain-containing protein n=1 Tax=Peterkaempfera griseoplana TaxID=66896 RepID=UPI0006E3DDD9|nr:DUF2637 domain-containing protein [Peterkaempfera griseoplana]